MTEIKNLLERLSDDLLANARQMAEDNGWSNQGAIPFDQAIAVVQRCRGELTSAVDEGIVDAMPRQFAATLQSRLSNLASNAENTVSGSAQVSEFVSQAEALDQDVFTWGLRYKSKKLLGFDSKLAALKRLSDQLAGLLKVAEDAARQRDQVAEVLSETTRFREQFSSLLAAGATSEADLRAMAEAASAKQSELDSQIAIIASKVSEATSSAASAQAKLQEASTAQEALEAYYQKVTANESRLNKAVERAATTVQRHNQDTEALIERLTEIEQDIRDKLERATGVTLFEAFGKRQEAIKKGLPRWLYASVGILLLSAGYSVWLLLSAGSGVTGSNPGVVFYVKLGFSLSFFAAVAFTLRQYSKERRLEEEYAFKAAISVSLAAYRTLVQEALENLTPEEKKEYATFLTKSIGTIFDPPTERVFGDRRSRAPSDTKVLASVAETIKPITDLMRPGR